jgi:hypothetical protein
MEKEEECEVQEENHERQTSRKGVSRMARSRKKNNE